MVSEPLPSLRWGGACTRPWGSPAGTCWDTKNRVISWGSPAGTLGTKRGWLWRPTSLGNGDVLKCINTPFLTQRVLKMWWSWTYQNSAIKLASTIVVPGWVTSWEVWFGGAKSGQYCVVGVGCCKWYQSQSEMGGACTSPWESPTGTCWNTKNKVIP